MVFDFKQDTKRENLQKEHPHNDVLQTLHQSAIIVFSVCHSVSKLSTHTKYKTLSLLVMSESLKAFLIFSRAGIAIICLAKLESFQLLFQAGPAIIH